MKAAFPEPLANASLRGLFGADVKKIDLTGQTFGRLFIEKQSKNIGNRISWDCNCICGKKTVVLGCNLVSKHTTSCGCFGKEKLSKIRKVHGMHDSNEYKIWRGIRNRCFNKNEPAYKNYGGRGITVCERWNSFENFLIDMGRRPNGLSIERVNVNGNYEPGNCCWVTMKAQQANRRDTVRVCISGSTKPLKHWCDDLGIAYKKVHLRLTRYGKEINTALGLPFGTAQLIN